MIFGGSSVPLRREVPGLQTLSQGDARVAAPVEEEGCDFCKAVSTLSAQIGLVF